MKAWTPKNTLIVAGVAVVALWYLKNQAGEAAQAVNPVNPDNIFKNGADSVGKAISGDEGWNLGGWLYRTFNDVPEPVR